jgi:hypothetical protein
MCLCFEPIMRARERKYRFNCRSHKMKTAFTGGRATWRIMRTRSTGAASASRMLCLVSAMNASSSARARRSLAATPRRSLHSRHLRRRA